MSKTPGVVTTVGTFLVVVLATVIGLGAAPGSASGQELALAPLAAADSVICFPPTAVTPAADFEIEGNIVCESLVDWYQTGLCSSGLYIGGPGCLVPQVVGPVSLWHRDWVTAGSVQDSSVFSGASNKNDDNVVTAPWNYDKGDVPQKDDLTEIGFHARPAGDGHLWLFGFTSYRSTSGTKHFDFELSQAGYRPDPSAPGSFSGILTGLGPNNGRTFGDVLISVDYEQGGGRPCVSIRVWNNTAWVPPSVPGTLQEYLELYTRSAVNTAGPIPVPCQVFEEGSGANFVSEYAKDQFLEWGIDVSAFLPGFGISQYCQFSQLMVKTRSSASFTSELKDFALLPVPKFTHVTAAGDEACQGTSAQLTSTPDPTGGTYAWYGPDNLINLVGTSQNLDFPSVALADAGVYTVIYTAQGCADTATAALVVSPSPTVSVPGQATCYGRDGQLCATVTGSTATPFTYSWSGGGTSSCKTIAAATATATYSVTVTDANGCTGSGSGALTVNPNPICSLSEPNPLPVCVSADNPLCVTITNGVPITTYEWSLRRPLCSDLSWQITPANAACITYYAGNPFGPGCAPDTFQVIVTSDKGCKDTCSVAFNCTSVDTFCTFTQGYYGNPIRVPLINSLLSQFGPMTIGKLTGGNSVTFPVGSGNCIALHMPAGGTATTLWPTVVGHKTLGPYDGCQTVPALAEFKNNRRFYNVFLGQMIALSLNTRYDVNLSALKLCKTMETDHGTFGIPERVLTALDHLGLYRTVAGLLELANRGIAGLPTDVATIGDLNSAVDAINNGFDECRLFVKCIDGAGGPAVVGGRGGVADEGEPQPQASLALPIEFGLSASIPNPFSRMTAVRLSLPERSNVRLSVFNILGQEVAVLTNREFPAGIQTVEWSATAKSGAPVAPGVYFFRMRATGMDTRKEFTQTQKVLFIK